MTNFKFFKNHPPPKKVMSKDWIAEGYINVVTKQITHRIVVRNKLMAGPHGTLVTTLQESLEEVYHKLLNMFSGPKDDMVGIQITNNQVVFCLRSDIISITVEPKAVQVKEVEVYKIE